MATVQICGLPDRLHALQAQMANSDRPVSHIRACSLPDDLRLASRSISPERSRSDHFPRRPEAARKERRSLSVCICTPESMSRCRRLMAQELSVLEMLAADMRSLCNVIGAFEISACLQYQFGHASPITSCWSLTPRTALSACHPASSVFFLFPAYIDRGMKTR